MEAIQNPLFATKPDQRADVENLDSPTVFKRNRNTTKRDIRDLRRKETAAETLEGFSKDAQIYGFTKGQFSLIDLISAILEQTGSATLDISTWTAARIDVKTICDFVNSGKVSASRWLVDLTFQRRTPVLADQIRKQFGRDAIRVAQNHAKFALIANDGWKVVLQTSMNLNFNPRFENFSIANDPELYDFHRTIIDEIWRKQPRGLASARPSEIQRNYRDQL